MKTFKQYITEAEIDTRPVIFKMADDFNTFGDFMKRYSSLNTIIKELAVEDEWSAFEFNSVKSISIHPQSLEGNLDKVDTINYAPACPICAIIHCVTNDVDDLEHDKDSTLYFLPDSIHYAKMFLRVNNRLYIISTDETIDEVERVSKTFAGWRIVLQKVTHNVAHTIKDYVQDVKFKGREAAAKNYFSDIEALLLFV